jgi:hypothetical protein
LWVQVLPGAPFFPKIDVPDRRFTHLAANFRNQAAPRAVLIGKLGPDEMPRIPQNTPSELPLTERAVSLIAGLVIAAAGAKPRPNKLLNIAALAAGSYLAYRGATGNCPVKQALLGSRERR